MGKAKREKYDFFDRLKNKYRLVVLNDETFEEKASFRLSRFNVYVLFSTQATILIILTYLLIAFTPLREYIPGYGDVDTAKMQIELQERIDSLTMVLDMNLKWQQNVTDILKGEIDTTKGEPSIDNAEYDSVRLDEIPDEDFQLREEIEREENYALIFGDNETKGSETLAKLSFFPPIKGFITQKFTPNNEHFGVDVVAPEDAPIKAVLDGTVILSEWTLETGYVIGIQHDYDLISFYKHNSVLLKKVGNFVKAGDAIAIIGNSGELTTGPHLHFELWHERVPVNPEDFMIF